jgi:AraC family transcriptional regulator
VVLSGGYEEQIRGESRMHELGHLLFCPAFEPHAQNFARAGALKLLLQPSAAALEYLNDRIALKEAPFTHSARIHRVGMQLLREVQAPDRCSDIVSDGLCAELIGLLVRGGCDAEPPSEKIVHAAARYIVERGYCGITISEVAEALGADPLSLAADYRRVFGKSFGQSIREGRLSHAVKLLGAGTEPLAQIAMACGFYDQAHFRRAFKASFGSTPGGFRRSLRTVQS